MKRHKITKVDEGGTVEEFFPPLEVYENSTCRGGFSVAGRCMDNFGR